MSTCRQFVAPFSWKSEPDPPPERPSYPIRMLKTIVSWPRQCEISGKEETFEADRECCYGFIGECTHCGEERIAPFTRANSEAS